MDKLTICFTYFKSLSLSNLEAALYTVRQQDLPRVQSIIIVDNDSPDERQSIQNIINDMQFPVPVELLSFKHGDATKTHSWSTNVAISHATTPWVLFTRADYLLDFNLLLKFYEVMASKPRDWDGFITGNVYHLQPDIGACNTINWRRFGPSELRALPGTEEQYMVIDAGVWMIRRQAHQRVGGLDESLTAWGHAQTHFQYKLHQTGTEFVRIPQPLFFHPMHGAPRDISLAHQQLQERGINIKELWARYEGVQPY